MSEPPPYTNTPATPNLPAASCSLSLIDPQQHQYRPSSLSYPTHSGGVRDYRKGNWTVQETLTLIFAKRLDDDRRFCPKASASPSSSVPRSAEQRWKWVENYCWNQDCLRSQNQCNDKWDNLLRDYKKVRDYESKSDPDPDHPSYWSLDRHDRKHRNLPTNLSREVFDALTDVLTRRSARRTDSASPPAPIASLPPPPPPQQPSLPPPPDESDPEEEDQPETKRRKLKSLGSSVVQSASVLAQTLLACEEKKEQRHRELLELEERRVKLEEERTEMSRQAVTGLISAVNGLSSAILALVSDHRSNGP